MSDQADGQFEQTQQQAPEQQSQEQAPQDPLMTRMDELTAMVQGLAQPQPPQDTRGLTDYATEPWQDQGDDDQYEQDQQGYGEEDPDVAYQQLQQLIQQQVSEGVQQHVQPFIVRQQAEALEQKYPDFKDPVVAARIVNQAEQFARQLGAPQLARSPQLIEKLYLAERASTAAAQETPADGGTGVHLEGGAAQPQQPVVDERDRIVGLGQSNNTFGWT